MLAIVILQDINCKKVKEEKIIRIFVYGFVVQINLPYEESIRRIFYITFKILLGLNYVNLIVKYFTCLLGFLY